MSPIMTLGQLQDRLRAIEVFQAAGDLQAAARARRELAYARLLERLEPGSGALRAGDIALLIRCAGDAQVDEEHEVALDLLSAARSFAERIGSETWTLRSSLHAAYSCVALLDLAAAAQVLRTSLSLPTAVSLHDKAAVAAAAGLVFQEAEEDDLRSLRQEALYALARYLAASGALLNADAALDRLLNEPPSEAGWISVEDAAIFAAELRLDGGDFSGFDALHRRWCTDQTAERHRHAWLLLEGGRLHLQGQLSEARNRFEQVTKGVSPSVPRSYAQSARWQLTQTLSALNCMDEAEAELKALVSEGAVEFDVRALAALLAARRAGGAAVFDPLGSPREMAMGLVEPPRMSSRTKNPGNQADVVRGNLAPEPATRRYERVRDDWVWLANATHLDLERGNLESAGSRLLMMVSWMPDVQSSLLQARFLRLAALVAFLRGQPAEAEQLASEVLARFGSLGMPADEWDASRLRYRAMIEAHAPQPDIDAEGRRGQVLLRRVRDRLDPADRSLYLLNKWSTVDDEILARLNAVGECKPGWGYRRKLRHAMQAAAVLRRWEAPSRWTGGQRPEEPTPTPGIDVFSWVRSQSYAKRGSGRGMSEALPLHPVWLAADAAVLHYFVLPTRIEALLMHRGGCDRLKPSRSGDRRALYEIAVRALDGLAGDKAGIWTAEAKHTAVLAEMLALPDLEQRLPPGVRRLAIVLDDVVVHVPFAALPFRGAPLVCGVTPYVVPYARWEMRSVERARRYNRALGVGVRKPPYALAGADGARHYDTLGDPSSEFEAMARVSVHPQDPLCEKEATVSSVLEAMPRAELLHFVCHGDFFAGRPNPSKLLLWDRPLEVPHIQAARLHSLRLVIMGACWAAGTRVLPGRELVGMPSAFLERGAGAALAALWELPDLGTAVLMRELFTELKTSGPADALARVQRRWYDSRPLREWAGYQMYVAGVPPRPIVRAALALVSRLLPEGLS